MEGRAHESTDKIIFTPDNEPYLGRPALLQLDQILIVLAAEQNRIGPWTKTHQLSPLQRSAAELIPGASSIAFSIRELVRQGYLLSARILVRSLAERVSTFVWLIDHEAAVDLWQQGWPHGSRPSLKDRLAALGGPGEVPPEDVQLSFDELRQTYNSLVHGDPQSAWNNAVLLPDGTAGHSVSKDLSSPARADNICWEVSTYCIVATTRCAEVFPPGH